MKTHRRAIAEPRQRHRAVADVARIEHCQHGLAAPGVLRHTHHVAVRLRRSPIARHQHMFLDLPAGSEAVAIDLAAVGIDQDVAKRLNVIPLFMVDNTLTVATGDPQAIHSIDEIRTRTGFKVRVAMFALPPPTGRSSARP